MSVNEKFKIGILAKGFDLKGKDIVDLLASKGFSNRNTNSSISKDEFNVIFNELTNQKQVDRIDDYLEGVKTVKEVNDILVAKQKEIEEAKKAKEAEEKAKIDAENARLAAEKAKEEAKKKAEEDARKKAEEETRKKADSIKSQNKISADNKNNNQNKFDRFDRSNIVDNKKNKPEVKKTQTKVEFKPTYNNTNAKIEVIEETNSGIKGARIVDTRSSSFDESKYEDKNDYSNYANDRNYVNEKQKIKKSNKPNEMQGQGKGKFNKADSGKQLREEKNRAAMIAGRDITKIKNKDKAKLQQEKEAKKQLEIARNAQLQVSIPDTISVGELASRLKVTAPEVIKKAATLGMLVSINDIIDYDTAAYVAEELGALVNKEVVVTIEEKLFEEKEDDSKLEKRPPVVVVMGHVDHGKTSLLDKIRNSSVASGEAGGITQAIGAYRVNAGGSDITFLDTPGHAAFTAMRARGAKATDIAILVVAADDGIMPQTVEAINHAKDANLEIIVAINKMDKPAANKDAVMQELTKYELIPEEWGGDIMCVPVSAHTGMGIDTLLEDIALIAEMKEYKANPARRASGVIIESKLEKGRGPVATVLVQNGTLHSGDIVIAGTAVGRVRAMNNEYGKMIKEAGPSVPVEIVGLDEVPSAGDEFNSVEDERMARELADQRKSKAKEESFRANATVSLDDLFANISAGVKELKIIVKADVAGSAEAVKAALEKLSNEEVKVKVIHSAVGGITEGDVMFAAASSAIIIGFSVRPDKGAIDSAERQNVDIRTHRIIYECVDEVEAAMKGMLAPTFKENLLGHSEVRQTIHISNVGTIAGCYVTDGMVKRSAKIRVLRDGIVIYEDKISSLKRFKEDKSEVASGYECGIGLEKFNDIKVGDVLEAFEMVEVER